MIMATQAPIANLEALLDRLVKPAPSDALFVTVYVDARVDGQGKRRIDVPLSQELGSRARAVSARQRAAYEKDAERIQIWLRDSLPKSARAAACFACADADVFEAIALDTPIDGHHVHVGPRPHVYPLMQLFDRYRRYAAVVADTSYVRIFVFGLNTRLAEADLHGTAKKTMDSYSNSQARFQRHVADVHHRFAKEVAETLERIVREERIDTIILAGDDVAIPLFRDALPGGVRAKVVEAMHLDVHAPEHQVLQDTLEAFHRHDAHTDAQKVQRLFEEFRAGGLGVVGVRDTRRALEMGQVDELLIAADPSAVRDNDLTEGKGAAEVGEELVEGARRSAAKVTFIEQADLLAEVGGVGGLLRFRVSPRDGGSTTS
jgi:protein required for attachment to host cells